MGGFFDTFYAKSHFGGLKLLRTGGTKLPLVVLNEYINTSFSQIELLENIEKKYNKIKLSDLSKNDILNLNQTKEMYLLDIKNSISSIMLMLVNIKTSN